jgi:hypothetical protein
LRAFHLLSWLWIVQTSARTRLIVALFCVAMAARAQAQVLPERPLRSPAGRLVVSAEVIATLGSEDDTAFFNYTDYEHNALRMLRLGTSGVWRPTGWLALAGEIRSEDLQPPSGYAA